MTPYPDRIFWEKFFEFVFLRIRSHLDAGTGFEPVSPDYGPGKEPLLQPAMYGGRCKTRTCTGLGGLEGLAILFDNRLRQSSVFRFKLITTGSPCEA